MYGLVNKAVEDLVTTRFGTHAWEDIAKRAGVEDVGFISIDPYPDEITYALLAAASRVLETPVEQLLEDLGEHWTHYTAREGYGDLLGISGESFHSFLESMDSLHTRIALSFPKLKPPAFECERKDDGDLLLHYHSERPGFTPMVKGLLKGLADMFEADVIIEQIAAKADGEDHDVFLIKCRRG
ncbi:MAG: heme NO-binding domain-containing protein [Planctomycetota bacterium]